VGAGDVDGDGHLDAVAIVRVSSQYSIGVARGGADGTFAPIEATPIESTLPGNERWILVGDVTGEGRADAIVLKRSLNVTVYAANSDGTFAAPVVTAVTGLRFAGVHDVNGDGRDDVITVGANRTPSPIHALLSRGDGSFDDVSLVELLGAWGPPSFGDVDRDGNVDFAIAGGLFLGHGDGTFDAPIETVSLADSRGLAVIGDVDGDGNLDLALAAAPTLAGTLPLAARPGRIDVMLGRGDRTFAAPFPIELPFGPTILVAADVTGDGQADLVTGHDPPGGSRFPGTAWMLNLCGRLDGP
jgi:hypothetical protein